MKLTQNCVSFKPPRSTFRRTGKYHIYALEFLDMLQCIPLTYSIGEVRDPWNTGTEEQFKLLPSW